MEKEFEIEKGYIHSFSLGQGVEGYTFRQTPTECVLKAPCEAPFPNGVIYLKCEREKLESEIDRILEELREHGRPFNWRLYPSHEHPEETIEILTARGLKAAEPSQIVWTEISKEKLSQVSFPGKNQISFELVTESNFDDWVSVFADAFQLSSQGQTLDFFINFACQVGFSEDAPYKSFLGRYKEKPVSCVSTIASPSSYGSLFNIACLAEERGLSYGAQAAFFGAQKLVAMGYSRVGQFGTPLGVAAYARLGCQLGPTYPVMTGS